MKILTSSVHNDEPCWGVWQGPRQIPQADGSIPWRWITAVYVVRNDTMAEYTIDHGAEKDYERCTPMIIPSFGENRVGDLLDHAYRNLLDDKWWKRRQEIKAESTLIKDILEQEAERHEVIHNRSVIGPSLTVQRDDYPRQAVHRAFRDKRRQNKTQL